MSIKNIVTSDLPNITTYNADGNITSIEVPGNVTAGNIVATNIYGNLSGATGGYGNANVEALLSGGSLAVPITTSGLIAGGAGFTTGGNIDGVNISAGYFFGDGSNITGVVSSYNDANVTALLGSGNVSGNITTTGNVSGGYILGDGSQLTNIVSSYGDANVASYLTTYSGNITAFNVTAANTVTANTFIGTFQGNVSGNIVVPGSNTQVLFNNDGNAGASVRFTFDSATGLANVDGNVQAAYFIGDGSQLTGLTNITSIYNGTSNVTIPSSNGNINFNVGGQNAGRISQTGAVLGNADGTLGSQTVMLNGFGVAHNAPNNGFYVLPVRGGSSGTYLNQSQTLQTLYYNVPTSEASFAPVGMFSGIIAPWSGQSTDLTAGDQGKVIQNGSQLVMYLPLGANVPAGQTFTVYGSNGYTLVAVNTSGTLSDFIYYNGNRINANGGNFQVLQGEYATFISRGNGEYDVIGTALLKYNTGLSQQLTQATKIGVPSGTAWQTVVTMDGIQVQIKNDGKMYFATTSGTATFMGYIFQLNWNGGASQWYQNAAKNATLTTTFSDPVAQGGTMNDTGATWTANFTIRETGYQYRVTSTKTSNGPNTGSLIIERLI